MNLTLQSILFCLAVFTLATISCTAQEPALDLVLTSSNDDVYCFDINVEGSLESNDFYLDLSLSWDSKEAILRNIQPNDKINQDLLDYHYSYWSIVRFTLWPQSSIELENDFLFNICLESLKEERSAVVLSYLIEKSSGSIVTQTDSILINPNQSSKIIKAQFEQSDLIFPPNYNGNIFLTPLRFDKTECLHTLEFDLLFDTNELRLSNDFLITGFGGSPLVKSPIEGGYRLIWKPWDYTASINNEFNIPLRKRSGTPGIFEVYAQNFTIENFEGDQYSIDADTALLHFEDTSPYDFIEIFSVFEITEEFQPNKFSVLAKGFREIREFQLDIFLPKDLKDISLTINESLRHGDVEYNLIKLKELDYMPFINLYRLNWSRTDSSTSVSENDTLFQIAWINEREIPKDAFGIISLDSRYFADKNLNRIPSTSRSRFEYEQCNFVDPVIEIYASPTGSDIGLDAEVPVHISLGRNHNVTNLSFDICFEPFMVSSIEFQPETIVDNAIISTRSYSGNEAIPCINFVWQSDENDISGDDRDVLLGHAIIKIKDNAPGLGRIIIEPNYAVTSYDRCEALVQLESTCPLLSEKVFIYPFTDMMRFKFDSIYGRKGEIKNLTLSVNQTHNLKSFDLHLEIDTQLVDVQAINILELDHPWEEELRYLSDRNKPIIRGSNLPKLESNDIGATLDLCVLELLVKKDISGCEPIVGILSEESRFRTHAYTYSFRENETNLIQVSNAHLCNDAVSNREVDRSTLSIYPNPATDQVTLSYPDYLQVEKIYLRDLSGRIIQEWDGRQEHLDVRGLQGFIQ